MELSSELQRANHKNYKIFSLTFAITGVLLACTGLFVNDLARRYEYFLTAKFFSLSTCAIVLGSLAIIIAILAYRLCNKGRVCNTVVFNLVFVVLVTCLAVTINAYLIASDKNSHLILRLPSYTGASDWAQLTRSWDIVQTVFHCCGIRSYKDWKNNLPEGRAGLLPLSCCKIPTGILEFKCTPTGMVYRTGCYFTFGDYFTIVTYVLSSVFLISFVAQLAAIVLLTKCKFKYKDIVPQQLHCDCKSVILVSKRCSSHFQLDSNNIGGKLALPFEPCVKEQPDVCNNVRK